jgi:hypothetical protein
MSKEINIEDSLHNLFDDSGFIEVRRKLQKDIDFCGICIYKRDENGQIQYIDPFGEEGLKAQESISTTPLKENAKMPNP